jgi:hypothetical protein
MNCLVVKVSDKLIVVPQIASFDVTHLLLKPFHSGFREKLLRV